MSKEFEAAINMLESCVPAKKQTATDKTILQEANEVIFGDREKTYGDPTKNLRLIASYWSAHLSSKYKVKLDLTPEDVCGMMILLKQARLANTPTHRDSLVDICGYAALQTRVKAEYPEAIPTPVEKFHQ